MIDDESEQISIWQIYLHPRRAKARMQQLHIQAKEALTAAEQQKARVLDLEDIVSELRKERSALQAANTELELKYARLEQEQAETDKEIEEIQIMFERVEGLKRRYDRRLASCKEQVAELQRTLKNLQSADDDIAPIPPAAIRPKPTLPARTPTPPADDDDIPDWYHPLKL